MRRVAPLVIDAYPEPVAFSGRVHFAVTTPVALFTEPEAPVSCCVTQTGASCPLGLNRSSIETTPLERTEMKNTSAFPMDPVPAIERPKAQYPTFSKRASVQVALKVTVPAATSVVCCQHMISNGP